MIKRIVEIGNPAYLHLQHDQLVIEREGEEPGRIPIEDLGILILDNHSIRHSQKLLVACGKANVVVVLCDEKHLPGVMILPLAGNSLQTKILSAQANASEPSRKRIWQSVVQAKIRAQGRVLLKNRGDDTPFPNLVQKVRSGDPDNVESQAARIYWPKLFGKDFRRDPTKEGINSLLNYGYAIVRAAVARAICGAGLHPSIGVHHHNQYDSFCLADDLMEPLRPLVDDKVAELNQSNPESLELTQETKKELLNLLNITCRIGDRDFPILIAFHQYSASLRKMLMGEANSLEIPTV